MYFCFSLDHLTSSLNYSWIIGKRWLKKIENPMFFCLFHEFSNLSQVFILILISFHVFDGRVHLPYLEKSSSYIPILFVMILIYTVSRGFYYTIYTFTFQLQTEIDSFFPIWYFILMIFFRFSENYFHNNWKSN